MFLFAYLVNGDVDGAEKLTATRVHGAAAASSLVASRWLAMERGRMAADEMDVGSAPTNQQLVSVLFLDCFLLLARKRWLCDV